MSKEKQPFLVISPFRMPKQKHREETAIRKQKMFKSVKSKEDVALRYNPDLRISLQARTIDKLEHRINALLDRRRSHPSRNLSSSELPVLLRTMPKAQWKNKSLNLQSDKPKTKIVEKTYKYPCIPRKPPSSILKALVQNTEKLKQQFRVAPMVLKERPASSKKIDLLDLWSANLGDGGTTKAQGRSPYLGKLKLDKRQSILSPWKNDSDDTWQN